MNQSVSKTLRRGLPSIVSTSAPIIFTSKPVQPVRSGSNKTGTFRHNPDLFAESELLFLQKLSDPLTHIRQGRNPVIFIRKTCSTAVRRLDAASLIVIDVFGTNLKASVSLCTYFACSSTPEDIFRIGSENAAAPLRTGIAISCRINSFVVDACLNI